MKIISFKICPFVQRVTALMAAKQSEYELEYISLKDKPSWFMNVSPNGQVPVLVTDNGVSLFESDAIVEYIDEISLPLQPEFSPEQKALQRAWSYLAAKNYLLQCSTMRSADASTLEQRRAKLDEVWSKLEKYLTQRSEQDSHGDFFFGSSISNVDLAWLVLLHRADIIRRYTGFDMLENFPHVQRLQQALMLTDIVQASVADDFEQAFVDFYLSDKTWLGQQALMCKNHDKPVTQSDGAELSGPDQACASGSCC